jgi:uracil-DNA glycosylase family 4
LVAYRAQNQSSFADWHNAPVASFGGIAARLLVVGLAPGLRGANRTGRPFTGDSAGDLLYRTLIETGFAVGEYDARCDDGLRLVDCRITNAVRCVPPENKPKAAEIRQCGRFLDAEFAALGDLEAVLALGRIAHDAVLSAHGASRTAHRFGHGARHRLANDLTLFDSYHCSRYNTNTKRLTPEMFRAVVAEIRTSLSGG